MLSSYFDPLELPSLTDPEAYMEEQGQGQGHGQGQGQSKGDLLAMLSLAVAGVPGEDYPVLSQFPKTDFSCRGRKVGGYYADPATR